MVVPAIGGIGHVRPHVLAFDDGLLAVLTEVVLALEERLLVSTRRRCEHPVHVSPKYIVE